jgi:hypothetical protein
MLVSSAVITGIVSRDVLRHNGLVPLVCIRDTQRRGTPAVRRNR